MLDIYLCVSFEVTVGEDTLGYLGIHKEDWTQESTLVGRQNKQTASGIASMRLGAPCQPSPHKLANLSSCMMTQSQESLASVKWLIH